jgi:hypothetical protein
MNYQPIRSVACRDVIPIFQDVLVKDEVPMVFLSILRRKTTGDAWNREAKKQGAHRKMNLNASGKLGGLSSPGGNVDLFCKSPCGTVTTLATP